MTATIAIAAGMGIVAGFEDLRRRKVPNWLTGAGAAAGLACAWYRDGHGGWHAMGVAAAGMIAGFLTLLPFYLLGAMGGGDVKLMSAFGALLGPYGILLAAVFAGVVGGIWAAVVLLHRPRSAVIPYAPALVLGAWFSLLGGGS